MPCKCGAVREGKAVKGKSRIKGSPVDTPDAFVKWFVVGGI
jgi:hypothetical protein